MEVWRRVGFRFSLVQPVRTVCRIHLHTGFLMAKCCLHICSPQCPKTEYFFLWFSCKNKENSFSEVSACLFSFLISPNRFTMFFLNQSLGPEVCHVQISLGLSSSTSKYNKGHSIILNSKQFFSGVGCDGFPWRTWKRVLLVPKLGCC